MPHQVLTLLSDFGDRDVYVGVMKGAIAKVNSSVSVVDLTHQIAPQDIAGARFCLMNAYPYFPKGTVHVAVVDPGVGSTRRAVAVELANGFLVGPDNGLLSGVLSQEQAIAAVELTNSQYWNTHQPSATFHGRDIFAPVGAHLASGVPLKHLGRAIAPATLVQLTIPECIQKDTEIVGCVQYVDGFGNLITNVPGTYVQGKTWSVIIKKLSIPGCRTYSDMPLGSPVALVGSHGWVEIAVNGSKAHQLQLSDAIKVVLSGAANR